jgi:hypothetical protein
MKVSSFWIRNILTLVSLFILNSDSKAQLTGTYTIGGITPDYTTFTLAVADLVASGVSGPLIFDVRDGTYPEQISIGTITGVSATNTVTFQSESGDSTTVILTFTPALRFEKTNAEGIESKKPLTDN